MKIKDLVLELSGVELNTNMLGYQSEHAKYSTLEAWDREVIVFTPDNSYEIMSINYNELESKIIITVE